MKKLLTILALIITTPALAAEPVKKTPEEIFIPPTDAPAEMTQTLSRDIVVNVDGMVCDFCAQSIKKVFGKQESVENVGVDLDKGEVIVDLKEGQTLDDEKIEEMVTFSGYDTTKITRK